MTSTTGSSPAKGSKHRLRAPNFESRHSGKYERIISFRTSWVPGRFINGDHGPVACAQDGQMLPGGGPPGLSGLRHVRPGVLVPGVLVKEARGRPGCLDSAPCSATR